MSDTVFVGADLGLDGLAVAMLHLERQLPPLLDDMAQ